MIKKGSVARRMFLSRLGSGLGLVGATAAGTQSAAAQSVGETRWQPTLHEQDDWMSKVPGQHRLVFDTVSTEGFASALQFANNFFTANGTGYGLKDSDIAVIIIARHKSTAFAYNDAIWAKYSATLSTQTGFTDPNTKEAPVVNVYGTAGDGAAQRPGRLHSLITKGAHLAVCQMATRAIAGQISRANPGTTTEAIFAELAANLVKNAHLAPAGIVAVSRAQERGYTFVNGG